MQDQLNRGADLSKFDSSANLDELKNVTHPGRWLSRKKSIRIQEEIGGVPIMWNPWLNKGTNFTDHDRQHLRLEGLLPPNCESLEVQAQRVMARLRGESNLNDLNRYNILKDILATNQTLFYKLLTDHIAYLAPIIYTPVVGEACQNFHHLFTAPLGMYLSAFKHRHRFADVLRNWPSHNVQIIVVTDGSRILGLGDLGINGVGISIGKISLFVGGAGFHPEHSLPLVLDVGTNNPSLIEDPLYMGEKQRRIEGLEYYAVIDELCEAVQEVWPNSLLQFEDFETTKAFNILEAHRRKMLCFNDDIQGTGGVVTAGFINGIKYQGVNPAEARVLFYGAGSSAVGVADAIATYLQHEAGLTRDQARQAVFMADSKGLVTTTRGDELPSHKKLFARNDGAPDMKDLREIVAYVKPHALIGLSGAGPSWGEDVIRELCTHQRCPLIFPLSNPTSKAEISAEDAYRWSNGCCVFASGSPFDPVEVDGQLLVPGQANNIHIFPGTGFGSVMSKAHEVTDSMFTAAAIALAGCISEEQLERRQLYPEIKDLRSTSVKVAAAVAKEAWDQGVSGLREKPADWQRYIAEKMWWPDGRTTRMAGMHVM